MTLIPEYDFKKIFFEPWSTLELCIWNGQIILMGILVCWTCGIVGSFIVVRRMALMGDAISHGILPGLALAFICSGSMALGPMWIGSCVAGITCSFCIEWLRFQTPIKEDAALGLVFTSFFATGVLMLGMEAENAHIDPECILYGEIGFTPLAPDLKLGSLRLGNQALWTMGGVFLSVAIAAVVFYRQILISSFDPILARSMGTPVRQVHLGLMLSLSLATVASLEAVGVILVVAMFVFPAVTASFFFDRLSSIVFFSLPLGLAYSIGGFHLAHWFDCSLAASMVVFAGLLFIPCCFLAPNSGILWKITSLRNFGR